MSSDVVFLLDTVTVSKLSPEQIGSDLVCQHCKIPEEILYELRDNSNLAQFDTLEYAISNDVLLMVEKILSQSVVQKLLDLYKSEGNGDVILLAVAITENEASKSELFGRKWVIVTDDKNLIKAAEANAVDTLDTASFILLL